MTDPHTPPHIYSPTNWERLQAWLTGDREERTVTIDVRADDPDYPDPEVDEAVWTFSYHIAASEVAVVGGEEVDGAFGPTSHGGASTVWEHHGNGDSIEEAAAVVLAMIAEHARVLGLPGSDGR